MVCLNHELFRGQILGKLTFFKGYNPWFLLNLLNFNSKAIQGLKIPSERASFQLLNATLVKMQLLNTTFHTLAHINDMEYTEECYFTVEAGALGGRPKTGLTD